MMLMMFRALSQTDDDDVVLAMEFYCVTQEQVARHNFNTRNDVKK